jgi:hypothetical protein
MLFPIAPALSFGRGDEEEGLRGEPPIEQSADALSATHGRDGSGQSPGAIPEVEPGST